MVVAELVGLPERIDAVAEKHGVAERIAVAGQVGRMAVEELGPVAVGGIAGADHAVACSHSVVVEAVGAAVVGSADSLSQPAIPGVLAHMARRSGTDPGQD